MGADTALDRALGLHDSNHRSLPLEFSMAAIFPSHPRNLRSRGAAFKAGVTDPGYSCAGARLFDQRRRVGPPYGWIIRFSAHLDPYWIGCGLVLFGIPATQ